MSPNFKHINADQQIINGSISTSLLADGSVTTQKLNINGDLTFNEHEALDLRVENVVTTPAPGNPGRVVWNTTSNQLLIDNGTAFVPVSSSGAVSGIFSDSNPVLTGTIQFLSGTNISLSQVGQVITINSTGSGTGITALTGDATATGPGSVPLTLATVNSNVGSFTNASFTVNAKGLITAASNGSTSGINYQQDLFDIVVPTNVFTLTHTPIVNSQIVFWNGLGLANGVSEDYTLSGTILTLNGSIILKAGDKILIVYPY